MKKYRFSICMVLLIALALSSFFVFGETVQETNGRSPVYVTFEPNGGQIPTSLLCIDYGAAVTPIYPTKEGYSFEGWYTTPDFSIPFSFGSKLSSGITLYAKWSAMAVSELTFGAYPQQRVTDADTLAHLNLLSPIDGYYEYNSKKYVAVEITDSGSALQNGYVFGETVYFEVAPITWQILKTVDDNHILITKNILECAPYHSVDEQITYAASGIRQFLNDGFYNMAFNSVEKDRIITSALTNPDNSSFHTDGGADTSDKVYILSIDEAKNGAYFVDNTARCVQGSDFAGAKGLWINGNANYLGLSCWWLRSPGDNYVDEELDINFNNAASIDSNGNLTDIGTRITSEVMGIRPVICVPANIFSEV